MFINDSPITNKENDKLDRANFSEHLGKAISNWQDKESLVIALNGAWGVGKSSIINLAIDEIENSQETESPTLVRFNPWVYSDLSNLTLEFFHELIKELNLNKKTEKDKILAEKLEKYINLLNIVSEENNIIEPTNKLLIGIGLSGISLSSLFSWFDLSNQVLEILLSVGGIVLILSQLLKNISLKISSLLSFRSKENQKTALDLKNEIRDELLNREKKLVVIIDDIDRLTSEEMKEIFRLIKINADFPNTIYLLSFDRNIVVKNLDFSLGVSGATYMEKIIQVTFDVPEVNSSNIEEYFKEKLYKIIENLPENGRKIFNSNSTYWNYIYTLGIRHFFNNLRSVKRFLNSLEFTISQMHKGKVMEVNTIDFIAIEAIRVFEPNFHSFLKQNKFILTTDRPQFKNNSSEKDYRQNILLEELSTVSSHNRESVSHLLKHLFPLLKSILETGTITSGFSPSWNKELRVCSPEYFDSYFVYLPKGTSNAVSQHEFQLFTHEISDANRIQDELIRFIKDNKIMSLLDICFEYSQDSNVFPTNQLPQVLMPLINIIDLLPEYTKKESKKAITERIISLINVLLLRDKNLDFNFQILKTIIKDSTSLYGVITLISKEDWIPKDQSFEYRITAEKHLMKLKKLCIERIIVQHKNKKLLNDDQLIEILYTWERWDDSEKFEIFIDEILSDNILLTNFLNTFKRKKLTFPLGQSNPFENYYYEFYEFNFLRKYFYKFRERIQKMKLEDSILYDSNRESIEEFIKHFESENL